MDFHSFTERLDNPKPFTYKDQPGVRSKCPAHDDSHPSFAAWEGSDGYIHMRCQVGCSEDAILQSLGLTQEDRRIREAVVSTRPRSETYTYTGPKGEYLFEKVRYYTKEGRKSFYLQCRFKDGQPLKKGEFRYPTPEDAGLGLKVYCLYNLPGVMQEAKGGGTVYFCNGEKAANAMLERGFMATCLAHGEKSQWKPYYADHLRGATVVIVAQRDAPATDFAKRVSLELTRAGVPCAIVNSKTEGEKDDAYDHLIAGYTPDEFVPRHDLLPDDEVRGFVWASEVTPAKVDWLFKPYFAFGTLAGIEGDPGIGKSLLAAAMACVASNGASIPALHTESPPINVLLYATEDAKEYTTVPRLMALQGNLTRIAIKDEVVPLDFQGLEDMKLKIKATQAKLVVIDPITAFIEAASGVQGAKINVHMIMDGLKKIAAETGACIICLRHLHKGNGSKDGDSNPIYAGLGSIAIVGKYRTCLQIKWDKKRKGYCNATHIKTNLGEYGEGFAYKVYRGPDDLPRFEWSSKYVHEEEDHQADGNWYDY